MLSLLVGLSAQTKIEILSTDELVYDQEIGRYQICRGNVEFKQGTVHMYCDSARFYEQSNRIEAFSNIYINQKDTLDLWGEHLEYDGDTRLARVSKNVKMTDGKMNLSTSRINYNLDSKVGTYTTGAVITNGDDKLTSIKGTYFSKSKEFFFKDSVKLTNPEYTMVSDTLKYNTNSKIASFYGPTTITSDENTIRCNYGWYNTEKEISQFSKNVIIEGEENQLQADSMVYYRETGYGEAYGNLVLVDTSEDVTITGEKGTYNRISKKTIVTGDPMAIKKTEDDSLFLWSDTLIDYSDSIEDTRNLVAFNNVQIFKSDFQSKSDSLNYNFTDSTISLFQDPVLWSESSQITGDTLIVYSASGGIDRLLAYNNGLIIDKDTNDFYNQIAGKSLTALFNNDDLYKVKVVGNGHSIYYAQEDSNTYAGVNDVICGTMNINLNENKVSTITFFSQPKATFYPLETFPAGKSRIEGFKWLESSKPKKPIVLNIVPLNPRVSD